ncbi:unnamed protein product [Pleuronectes platessa]|uniref:Uncharacterized protein n=1 Tax=Pleuronectes platessa TaxID=8262 RepID=A0A9N7U0A2_PLEPL|nr:unnamed protein product [Pleuronectes platessa]
MLFSRVFEVNMLTEQQTCQQADNKAPPLSWMFPTCSSERVGADNLLLLHGTKRNSGTSPDPISWRFYQIFASCDWSSEELNSASTHRWTLITPPPLRLQRRAPTGPGRLQHTYTSTYSKEI